MRSCRITCHRNSQSTHSIPTNIGCRTASLLSVPPLQLVVKPQSWGCLFVLTLILTSSVQASPRCPGSTKLNSYLWRVRNNPPVYLFGTIHVPYTLVWDYIPENAKTALANVDAVYLELDLSQRRTFEKLRRCRYLSKKQRIEQVLPPDLVEQLTRYMHWVRAQLPGWLLPQAPTQFLNNLHFKDIAGRWERLRPIWLIMTLDSLRQSDLRSRGPPVLDQYLSQLARTRQQRTGGLESVRDHCRILNTVNRTQATLALRSALEQQILSEVGHSLLGNRTHSTPKQQPVTRRLSDVVHGYACGELSDLMSSPGPFLQASQNTKHNSSEESAEVWPRRFNDTEKQLLEGLEQYFRETLITRRNHALSEKIQELLTEYPNESMFLAFGAGHFVGDSSVIKLLKRDGVRVKHIPSNRAVKPREKAPRRDVLTRKPTSQRGVKSLLHRKTTTSSTRDNPFRSWYVHSQKTTESPNIGNSARQTVSLPWCLLLLFYTATILPPVR